MTDIFRISNTLRKCFRNRIPVIILTICITLFSCACGEGYRVNPDDELTDSRSAIEMIESLYAEYLSGEAQNEARLSEMSFEETEEDFYLGVIEYGGNAMGFLAAMIGEPGEDGTYPLYITLHGGGAAEA